MGLSTDGSPFNFEGVCDSTFALAVDLAQVASKAKLIGGMMGHDHLKSYVPRNGRGGLMQEQETAAESGDPSGRIRRPERQNCVRVAAGRRRP
jgi:hypothetical protein